MTLRTPPGLLIHGQVMHERIRPVLHRFVYPVFYVRLNLARLDELHSAWFGINQWRIACVHMRDYGPRDGTDCQAWMRALLKQSGIDADGEIWLQTFPRLFGFAFNPVSFWYCYDRAGALRAVLAEVNNTFGESHRYVLHSTGPITDNCEILADKNLHVSPFCQVKGQYRFRFRDTASTTLVNLDYDDEQGVLIKTALGGKKAELTGSRIRRAVFVQPFLTVGVVIRIHAQALRLWLKRVPYFKKPVPPATFYTPSRLSPSVPAPAIPQQQPMHNKEKIS